MNRWLKSFVWKTRYQFLFRNSTTKKRNFKSPKSWGPQVYKLIRDTIKNSRLFRENEEGKTK